MDGKSVLAVEDDKFCLETLKMFLTAIKVDFTLATNGQEAVDSFKKKNYTLVLMDLNMPVMDGFNAAKSIRAFEKSAGKGKCKIIALSADDDDKTINSCLGAGMDSLIKKPIKKDNIVKFL